MKQYEIKEVTEKRKTTVGVTCDWCGIVSDTPFLGEDPFQGDYVCVSYESFPEISPGEFGCTGWEVEDLCHDCIDKLKVLLEENGVTVAEIDR